MSSAPIERLLERFPYPPWMDTGQYGFDGRHNVEVATTADSTRLMSAVRRTSSAGEVPGTSHRAWLARGMLRNSQSMTSMTSLLSPPLTSCDGLYISLAPTQQGERYACAGAQVHVCRSTRASAVLTHCRLCRRVSEAFALSTEVRETR